jgi:Holliday junction resolvase-like predicted endonuclease
LTRVARHYLQHHGADDTACRFDVLAVSLQEQGAATEHMQNAFLPLD